MLEVLPPLSNEYEHLVFQVKLHMIIPPQYSFVYNTALQSSPLSTVLSTRQNAERKWLL